MNPDGTNIQPRQNNNSISDETEDQIRVMADDKTQVMPAKNIPDKATRIQTNAHPNNEICESINQSQNESKIFSVGSVVRDRFELVAELGAGGMGTVYRALDRRKQEAEDESPYVAIKLLGEDFKQHPRAFVTLQRETKKTQALAHPNIVTVYDFDRDGDVIYMTMEELKGKTLEDILAEQAGIPIDKEQGLSIIRGIAQGLIFAHSKGIIHSDLKPGNIFVTDENQVKILDFGIARVVDESSYSDRYDVSELSALTPRYASIDMLEHKPPDPRDDLFALGII